MQKIRIAAVSIMVALVATITGGSIAYFTSQTGPVDNIFTIGAVDVSISQSAFDRTTGLIDPGNQVMSNNYGKVAGGDRLVIDPTITVGEDSADCYLITVLTISKWNADGMFNQRVNGINPSTDQQYVKSIINLLYEGFPIDKYEIMNMNSIVQQVFVDKPTWLTIILCSKEPVKGGEKIQLFSAIHPPVVNENTLALVSSFNTGKHQVNVTVYAIQADSISTPGDACMMATDMFSDFPSEYLDPQG